MTLSRALPENYRSSISYNSHCICNFIEYYDEHKIISYALSSHTTHLMQSLDVILFQLLKCFHKQILKRSIHSGCYDFNKMKFLTEIERIWQQAFKRSSIIHS